MNSIAVLYLLMPFFFILLLFGERKDRSSSMLIFISCLLNIITDSPIDQTLGEDEKLRLIVLDTNIAILWDSAIVLILITSKLFNQASGKQAILLSFAVLCHIVVVYDLTVQPYYITNLFCVWYVELIILVGLLQMAVSYNGFIGSLSNLQGIIRRFFNNSGGNRKGLLEQEES